MSTMSRWKNQSLSDKTFDIFNYILMALILLICLYPLYYIVIVSFSSEVTRVYLWPRDFSLRAYVTFLGEKDVWIGFANTVLYTAGAVLCGLVLTLPCAYALSRRDFVGGGLVMGMLMVTMFISGGLVPSYLNMYNLGLDNTRWAVIIVGLMSTYNVIVARTFFRTTIPNELLEAAQLDGCGDSRFFLTVVLPLSKPITAVLALYIGVAQWNSYFTEMIYLRDADKFPVTMILRRYLSTVNELVTMIEEGLVQDIADAYNTIQLATAMQYGLIVISTLPMLIVYPFIQKYFAKGVMIGSVKG